MSIFAQTVLILICYVRIDLGVPEFGSGFVDAWPSNWLYTQDVFVVEINGLYYLCNPMYPGVNITLSVAE